MASSLLNLPIEFSAKLIAAWATGKSPGKCALAAARAWGYMQDGQIKQALKDARCAVAFGQRPSTDYCWPPALIVLALGLEAAGEVPQAVLSIGK
eukprot:scaffold655599_cov46-Prasinocladus_malaysianus.AAC.1